mgnify:FL=1
MLHQKERINKIFIIVLILFLLSAGLLVFTLIIKEGRNLGESELYLSFSISDRSGFDVNTSALTMGMVRPGDSASRSFLVENNFNFPIDVELYTKGNVSRFIQVERHFSLNNGENKTVSISAVAASNDSYGFYDGKLLVVFKKR